MSSHSVDVVLIEGCEPHPNPEVINLGIVKVGGYTIVVNKNQWNFPCLAAYIEPESLVKVNRPEFEFLKPRAKDKEQYRVKVMKLQGVYSQGLLIPAPEGFKAGDDIMEFLEVEHYEPPADLRGGGNVKPPRIKDVSAKGSDGQEVLAPVYDVENLNKNLDRLEVGEEVIATEKVHGANFRAVCVAGELFVGSRTQWKADEAGSSWWSGLRNSPEVIEFLKANENVVIYGEIYGNIQNLKYGSANKTKLVLFDIFKDNAWVSWHESQEIASQWRLPWVPVVYAGPYDEKLLRELAEQDSIMPEAPAKHIREGIVVKPVEERWVYNLGRVQLKIVSNRYLDKT